MMLTDLIAVFRCFKSNLGFWPIFHSKEERVDSNSEFNACLTTYNIYWEGAISVEGSQTGKGFVEMNKFKH